MRQCADTPMPRCSLLPGERRARKGSNIRAMAPATGLSILHVVPYYEQAWAYGGIPRVASALARGLARRGHRVTVCTTDACEAGRRLSRAPAPAAADPAGVAVRVFRNVSNSAAYHLQLFTPVGLVS